MATKTILRNFVAGDTYTTRMYKIADGQGDLVAGSALKEGATAGELEFVTANTDEVFAVLVNDVADKATSDYETVYIKGTFSGSGITVASGTTWEEYFAGARGNQLLFISK